MKVELRYSLVAVLIITGCACVPISEAQFRISGSFARTLTVSEPVDLDVSTGSGSIDIREGSAGGVQVEARYSVNRRRGADQAEELSRRIEANPPITQTGDSIRIGYSDDPDIRRYVSISYTIIVPPRTRVRSHTGSGRVAVTGVAGPVDAETGSGSIELTRIGGAVTAHTGSGRITASLLGAGDVEVSTGSGGIEVTGVKGALRANSGSGRISVDGDPTGRWNVSTGSGSVDVRLPATAAFDLYAQTSSGGITLDHPLTVSGRIGRRNLISGKVRGGGHSVEVRTSSGSIRIE